jgi:hypothetical protein
VVRTSYNEAFDSKRPVTPQRVGEILPNISATLPKGGRFHYSYACIALEKRQAGNKWGRRNKTPQAEGSSEWLGFW